jgi:hypothetical protein
MYDIAHRKFYDLTALSPRYVMYLYHLGWNVTGGRIPSNLLLNLGYQRIIEL